MLLLPKTPSSTYPKTKKIKGPKVDHVGHAVGHALKKQIISHWNSFGKGYVFDTLYS